MLTRQLLRRLPSLNTIAGIALGAIAVSLTVPGVPGGAIIVMSPALVSL